MGGRKTSFLFCKETVATGGDGFGARKSLLVTLQDVGGALLHKGVRPRCRRDL